MMKKQFHTLLNGHWLIEKHINERKRK